MSKQNSDAANSNPKGSSVDNYDIKGYQPTTTVTNPIPPKGGSGTVKPDYSGKGSNK